MCSLVKELEYTNSSHITNVLDVRFKGKHLEFDRFRCIQLGHWNCVSSDILAFLPYRSKRSRTAYPSRSVDGRVFVRHEMYRDQPTGPRSVNFGKHMHVDKISSSTNFHPNRQGT